MNKKLKTMIVIFSLAAVIALGGAFAFALSGDKAEHFDYSFAPMLSDGEDEPQEFAQTLPVTLKLVFEGYELGDYDYAGAEELLVYVDAGDAETVLFNPAWVSHLPPRAGYVFDGTDEDTQAIDPNGGTVFHLRFRRTNVVLRLELAENSNVSQAFALRFGTPIAPHLAEFAALMNDSSNSTFYKYGHVFNAWSQNIPSGATLPAGGLTLSATYKPAQWTASFAFDSRTNFTSAVTASASSAKVVFGESFTLPSAGGTVRNYGYELQGWIDDAGVSHAPGSSLVMDKENRSFTADWKPLTFDVTFVYKQGDNPADSTTQTVKYSFDQAFNFPVVDNPVTADTSSAWAQETGRVMRGHALSQWICQENSAIKFSPDEKGKLLLEGNMTLVATQNPAEYPVIFTWSGGTKTVMVKYAQSINSALTGTNGLVWLWDYAGDNNTVAFNAAPAANRAKTKGYSIDTWTEELRTGTSNDYNKSNHNPNFGTMSDNTRKFTAIETAIVYPVRLYEYNDARGQWNLRDTLQVTFDSYATPPNLYHATNVPGRYFMGWSANQNLNAVVGGGRDAQILMSEEGMNLYARYDSPVNYYVNFYDEYDKLVKTELVHTENKTQVSSIAPADRFQPTPPEGYHFTTWSDEDDGQTVALTRMPARRVNFYGEYKINRFDVVYKYKDKAGKWVETAALRHYSGQTLSVPSPLPNVTSSTYEAFFNTNTERFTGWNTGIVPGRDKAVGANSGKITYTAQYTKPKISNFTAALPRLQQPFAAGKPIDLALEDLVLTVTYDNGNVTKVDHIKGIKAKTVTYTPKKFEDAGQKEITITYKSPEGETVKATLPVSIAPRKALSIKMSKIPKKTSYTVGEKLNITGGEIEVRYNNDTRQIIPLNNSAVKVTGFSSKAAVAKQTLTVTYTSGNSSYTTSFVVTIKAKEQKRAKGDVNGDGKINSLDMLKIRQHILDIKKLTTAEFNAADINGDGKVNSLDAIQVLRHILDIKKIK